MSKVLVNESSLTGIANAIRGKNGSTTTYKPSEMAAAITAISGGAEPTIEALSITANGTYTAPDGVDGYSPVTVNVPQDGSPPESAFVISGNCQYRFAYNGWNWFTEQYGDRITTQNITNAQYMFLGSTKLVNIPFELNFDNTSNYHDTTMLFQGCSNLITLPRINNLKVYNTQNMFNNCYKLRTIPEDFADSFDWSYLESQTSAYNGSQNYMFSYCYSLRSFPFNLINKGNPNIYCSYSYFSNGFKCCYSLDELVNLPIPYTATWNSNAFGSAFDARCCWRAPSCCCPYRIAPQDNTRDWLRTRADYG